MSSKNSSKLFRILCRAGLTIGAIYAFNKIHYFYAVKNRLLTARPENFFVWRGLRVYYTEKGSGSPVLLIHAAHPAASAYEWNEIEDRLAKNHKVYTLDLPGCGRSDKPVLQYTSALYAAVIKDFVTTMSLTNAAAVASNLSAPITILANACEPGLFSSITLISPPSVSALSKLPSSWSRLKLKIMSLPVLGSFIYNLTYTRQQIDLQFSERYFYNPFHDTEELVNHYFESAHLSYGNGYALSASIAGNLLNIDIRYAARNTDIPVLILEGEAIPKRNYIIDEWEALNSRFEVITIEHTRELPHLEEPEKVVRHIANFLDQKGTAAV